MSSTIWPVGAAAAAYLLVQVGGGGVATLLQQLVVTPDEQARERPYIVHNIAATRSAFDLDQVEERQVSGDATLTMAGIENNAETINNVRLWDHEPLLDTFGQIQEIRTYYEFASVDNDRYVVDGEYRQTMLSARELNSDQLAQPVVDQRTAAIHARVRRRDGSGQRGDPGRAPGAVPQGSSATLRDRPLGRSAEPLLR